jgi:DNA helicase-2/ATP-dependent DNA helicase PcrA
MNFSRRVPLPVPVEFNPRQIEAIQHVHGPMLVVAGAGTGKTTVLTERIARLIRDKHAEPHEILALTFTDNAAAEMAKRVRERTECSGLLATTFHSYCQGLLLQTQTAFGVLSKEDLYIYLRQRIRELPLHHFVVARNPGEFLSALRDFFQRCHDELVSPADFQAWVQRLPEYAGELPRVDRNSKMEEMPREEQIARWQEIATVYSRVEEMLAKDNLGSFGHMITRAARLLKEDPELLKTARAHAKFLLIDEFQDVNLAQIELAELLAGPSRNIFAVGDPDQAIYRFRGATEGAFAEFVHRFPQTAGVVLQQNQRSRSPILKCGFSVISNNPPVHCATTAQGATFERQELQSARDQREGNSGKAGPVLIVIQPDEDQEAADIAQAVAELRQRPPEPDSKAPQIAVLYRSHKDRDQLVKVLAERGIPLAVTGIDALDTGEVRDLMACLRVMANLADTASLFRMATLPVFNVDPERLRELMANAPDDATFTSILEQAPGGREVMVAAEKAWAAARNSGMDTLAATIYILRNFGFDTSLPAVRAFCDFIVEWKKKPVAGNGELSVFLNHMDLLPEAGGRIEVPTDGGDSRDVVHLMTVHAAKGLEFDNVFVLRLNSGSFPLPYRENLFEFPPELRKTQVPLADSKDVHRQEERRLFYVAMTRARDLLTISTRRGSGKKETRPTAFVRELISDAPAKAYWRERLPSTLAITAGAAPPLPISRLGSWLLMPPATMSTVLSATSIETYETCPLQFKIQRDWQLPGEAAAQMQFGNAMHAALRDYYESVRAGRVKTPQAVVECFRAALSELHFDDPYQRELYERDGEEQLRIFVVASASQPAPQVIATERRFEFDLNGVRVTGRVDRLDRVYENRVSITDYKTGSPKNQQAADKSLQLSLYALAARDLWQFVPEELVIHNLKDNSVVRTTRSDDELAAERERVKQVAAEIAAGHFDATPGYHCRWCAYRDVCPETEEHVPVIPRGLAKGTV